MKISIFFFILFFISGCVSNQPQRLTKTESGHPEVVISNVNVSEVKSILLKTTLSNGFLLEKESDSQIVLTKRMKSSKAAGKAFVSGGNTDSFKEEIILSFFEADNNVKVIGRFSWTEMTSGGLIRHDYGNNYYNKLQEILFSLKEGFDAYNKSRY